MLRWLKTAMAQNLQGATQRFAPLQIVARGMCCALGHTAPAATAALNARINHFRESRFVAQGGRRVIAAMLHDVPAWGMERMALMLDAVVRETLTSSSTIKSEDTALIVCCGESQRPGIDAATFRQGIDQHTVSSGFHPSSLALHCGKGGFAEAMQAASALLYPAQHAALAAPQQVLLVGLDSLLVAGTIEQLIAMDRLLTATNSEGLIPAEGAAALLLQAVPADGNPALHAGLRIEAAATAVDDWRLDGASPARGIGLTNAVRAVLSDASIAMSDLAMQVSGMNGEGWYAREVNLMQSRCMTSKRTEYPHVAPAQWLGDAGAAGPVLALAWLADVMGRDTAACPGRSALAHFAGDDGRRSALVLRYHGGSPSLAEHRTSS